MAVEYQVIKAFLEKASMQGSRSTIMKPLYGFVIILISGFIASFYFKMPSWVLIFFCVLISLASISFFVAFFFCLFKDREALRSETFIVQKMAIEKGLIGDSKTGLLDLNDLNENFLLDENQDEIQVK